VALIEQELLTVRQKLSQAANNDQNDRVSLLEELKRANIQAASALQRDDTTDVSAIDAESARTESSSKSSLEKALPEKEHSLESLPLTSRFSAMNSEMRLHRAELQQQISKQIHSSVNGRHVSSIASMLGNIEKDHMELERHLLTAATEAEKVFMNKDDRYDGPWGAGISTPTILRELIGEIVTREQLNHEVQLPSWRLEKLQEELQDLRRMPAARAMACLLKVKSDICDDLKTLGYVQDTEAPAPSTDDVAVQAAEERLSSLFLVRNDITIAQSEEIRSAPRSLREQLSYTSSYITKPLHAPRDTSLQAQKVEELRNQGLCNVESIMAKQARKGVLDDISQQNPRRSSSLKTPQGVPQSGPQRLSQLTSLILQSTR